MTAPHIAVEARDLQCARRATMSPVDEVSTAKREAMRAQRERDTGPELALRRELHGRGLRYRVHYRVLPRRSIDIAFTKSRVAVFVDGCFWHGCPTHSTWPKANAQWWRAKIEANRARDSDTDRRLREADWLVVRVWEHEDPVEAADRVAAAVATRAEAGPQRD